MLKKTVIAVVALVAVGAIGTAIFNKFFNEN